MPTVSAIEDLALQLTVSERATLASKLLRSLPPVLMDEDEGAAEATRRYDEMVANPAMRMSMDELREQIPERFKR